MLFVNSTLDDLYYSSNTLNISHMYTLFFTQLIVYYYYVLPIYQIELRDDWNLYIKAGHSV